MRRFIWMLSIGLLFAGLTAAAVIPSGTQLNVRINENLDTRSHEAGDPFTAVLVQPVQINGRTLLPAGTEFQGHVTNSYDAGRLKGRAALGVALDSFWLNGQEYRIQTAPVQQVSKSHKGRNKALIGGGAGVGTAIGAITGGFGGAAVGALVGGGAGTGAAALTGKKHVTIPSEAVVRFQVVAPVRI